MIKHYDTHTSYIEALFLHCQLNFIKCISRVTKWHKQWWQKHRGHMGCWGSGIRVELEIGIGVCLPGAQSPEPFSWWSSAFTVLPGSIHTLPQESVSPSVPCISLASFKCYPSPTFMVIFYHLNYIDRIMQSLIQPQIAFNHFATWVALAAFHTLLCFYLLIDLYSRLAHCHG